MLRVVARHATVFLTLGVCATRATPAGAEPTAVLVPDFIVEPRVEIREAGATAGSWLRDVLNATVPYVRVVPARAWLPGDAPATFRVADPLSPAGATALHDATGARLVAQGYLSERDGRYAVEVRLVALPDGQVRHAGKVWIDAVPQLRDGIRRATALVFEPDTIGAAVAPPRPDAPAQAAQPPRAPVAAAPRRPTEVRKPFAPQVGPPRTPRSPRPAAPRLPELARRPPAAAAPAPVVAPVEPLRKPAPDDTATEPAPPEVALPPLTTERIAAALAERFPDMVYIPPGPFVMGTDSQVGIYEVDANPWRRLPRGTREAMLELEGPAHEVTLPGFLIDRTEVTNAQYRAYRPSHVYPPAHDNFPVAGVSWADAVGYARTVGKRLPTEAEWEKAARGGEARRWPWGNAFDPQRVAMDDTPVPVGIFPQGASPYGVLNMAGNVQEWTASPFRPYPGNTTPNAAYGEGYRVVRGSHWAGNSFLARTTSRFRAEPGTRGVRPEGAGSRYIGFRCARDLPPLDTLRRWVAEDAARLAAR